MTLKKLYEQIDSVKASMVSAKPRSRRRVQLEIQLRDLCTKAIISEMRREKRAA